MVNFFAFFDLPVSFFLDEEELKRRFLQNSKRWHPDFYTLDTSEKQADILELSTLNNQAWRTLSDFDRRMQHVLELKGIFAEEGKNQILQDFLADMMDLNEALMELEFDFDLAVFQKAVADLKASEAELLENIRPTLENYDEKTATLAELNEVKNFFFKKRYLWRIRENLDRFAPASKEAWGN